MENKPLLISVILTTYNYASYLPLALTSVLNQSFINYEIIIVDDGSTDGTVGVLAPYLDSNNPLIKYIKQPNLGQAAAKNRGIVESRGQFIAFLDADDLWKQDKLEKQMELFSNAKTGVVYSEMQSIDYQGKQIKSDIRNKYLRPMSGIVTASLIIDNIIPFSSTVIKKECFARVGMFDESLGMSIDWDLWLRISVHYEFAYVAEPLLYYRIGHVGQMSKNQRVRHRASDIIMEKFIREHPHLLSKSTIRKARGHTYCNRGDYYANKQLSLSLMYYLKAMRQEPFSPRAYKGAVKYALRMLRIVNT